MGFTKHCSASGWDWVCCLLQFPVRLLFVLDYKVLGPGTAVGSFSKLPGGRKISTLLLRERGKGKSSLDDRSTLWRSRAFCNMDGLLGYSLCLLFKYSIPLFIPTCLKTPWVKYSLPSSNLPDTANSLSPRCPWKEEAFQKSPLVSEINPWLVHTGQGSLIPWML